MDIDLPPGLALPGPASSIALEEDLATVFKELLADSKEAKDVVVDIYNICHRRAEALRNEASEQVHRPARNMHLRALAEELEAQAATWQLLFCLHCDEAAPAGDGGMALRDAGGAALYRQKQADAVVTQPELARCARVVAWLEALADDTLKRQGGAPFAPEEGLWNETRTEMRAGTGSVVSDLDPDAPSRSGRPLHASNARSQERIMARAWQLLRAGRLPEALDLCCYVGQPWRAAALGGGGQYGPLPVGASAVEHDEGVAEDVLSEELADEVAHGSGTTLALWRWAALQAAAAPAGPGASETKYERAVFGALGGSVAAAAAACSTWEDYAWLFCRCWLESQVARSVPLEPQTAPDLVPVDTVAAALARAGVPAAAAERSVQGAMAVVMGTGLSSGAAGGDAQLLLGGGSGPAAELAAAAAASSLSSSCRSFGQLFVQHVMAAGGGAAGAGAAVAALARSGSPAVQALRLVQGLLVQGDMYDLVSHLYSAIVDRRYTAAGGLPPPEASTAAGEGLLPLTAAGEDGSAAAGGAVLDPERRWRTCALAAHLLLALEGLGVMASAPGSVGSGASAGGAAAAAAALGDPFEVHKTLDLSQRLLVYFAGSLLERGQLDLLPPYLCALRPALRSSLCAELLALHSRKLTEAAEPGAAPDAAEAADACCYGAFVALDTWFRRCVERQQQPQEVLASRLVTDIRPNELRLQLATFTLSCRHSRAYGPYQRARVARWLSYPYIAAVHAAAAEAAERRSAQQQQQQQLDGPDGGTDGDAEADAAVVVRAAAAAVNPLCMYDVLEYANCTACELALGDDVTAGAGHVLFDQVLPPDLETAAMLAADALEQRAAEQQQEPAQQSPASLDAATSLRLAAQLREQASELAGWRLYFRLDERLAAWSARHEAAVAAGAAAAGPEAAEALAAEGGELLQTLLEELLDAGGWQQGLASAASAMEAAAAAGGTVRATLLVTCPPAAAAAAAGSGAGGGAAAWGQASAPYPELQGASLLEVELALRGGLSRAAAAAAGCAGVHAVEVAVESTPEVSGHVAIHLACPADPQSWRALVSVASGVVRGGLPGVPPLLLVGLEAGRATRLAVARRCCLAQAVLRCAGLRLSLVALGVDAHAPAAGPQLVDMLAAPPPSAQQQQQQGVEGAAGAGGCGCLLALLSAEQLKHVLAVEADTLVTHLRNGQRQQQQQHQRLQLR